MEFKVEKIKNNERIGTELIHKDLVSPVFLNKAENGDRISCEIGARA